MYKTKEISLKTSEQNQMIDITSMVRDFVKESHVRDGMCFIYVPHTTASIVINENTDPQLRDDILDHIERLIPKGEKYKHSSHAAAHIKASLLGNSKTLLIKDNKLLLGRWEALYFCEFSGPRERVVIVRVQV
ncbi:MAG: YjbQ family protein [Deltaproteobacteria bacterium]|nr:YjbQ family protein [Deltaproteobacteria bacterium]